MSTKKDKPGSPDDSTARPYLVSGGFDPDCELCRALSDPDSDVFGERVQEGGGAAGGIDVRQILDVEGVRELLRKEEEREKGS